MALSAAKPTTSRKTVRRNGTKQHVTSAGSARAKAAKPRKSASRAWGWEDADLFAASYLKTALFADLPEGYDFNVDVHPRNLSQIVKDCRRFQRENRLLLEQAYALIGPSGCLYDEWYAGSDFWLSRQGHGVGFRDRNLGEVGDRLDEAARQYSQLNVLPGKARDGNEYIFIE